MGSACFTALILLTGCRSATSPVQFYSLTPLAAESGEKKDTGSTGTLSVGIGPVEIPKSLDRPQIVTRIGPNKLMVDEFHRWAGSLYDDFLSVLTVNLAELLGTNRVAAYPWEEYFDPDYHIFMEVHRFDGNLGQNVVLDLTWTVTGRETREVLLVRKTRMAAPVAGMDYEAFISVKSGLLADLSREIAREIKRLHTGK
jgi:uncharacterized lipoprotein YmbA